MYAFKLFMQLYDETLILSAGESPQYIINRGLPQAGMVIHRMYSQHSLHHG